MKKNKQVKVKTNITAGEDCSQRRRKLQALHGSLNDQESAYKIAQFELAQLEDQYFSECKR
ncbi:MAG: hypothetical protein AAF614_36510 [Chloroflexota bacterium]